MAGKKGSGIGGNRGGGRPPRAVEDNVKAAIQRALKPGDLDRIWAKVAELSQLGYKDHIKILFDYYYGKPKDNGDQPTQMVIKVIRE